MFSNMEMSPPRSLAAYVARKVVKRAGNIRNNHDHKLWCLDCKLLPKRPVTGRCGHTRCTMCIEQNGACPCGDLQPEDLHSNILVRDILDKMMRKPSVTRFGGLSAVNSLTSNETEVTLMPSSVSTGKIRNYLQRSRLYRKHATQKWHKDISHHRMAATPQMRYEYARELASSGRYRDAAAHLAQVAATSEPAARMARDLLTQVITVLSPACEPSRIMRTLYQSVRQQSNSARIESACIECPICYNVMAHPVTTTCGHTFCRCCIKRTMLTRLMCPLCSSSLSDFYLTQTEDTQFVCALMHTIATKPQIDPSFVPIFACTVAFPDISCPLMIFGADFRHVINQVLGSGLRRFGMLASNYGTHYGTIVEVRDCVVLKNGSSILSTMGISRFRVIEKVAINGCPYARVQEHTDIIPVAEMPIFNLQLLAQQIRFKVLHWLPSLGATLRADIATCFGPFPEMNLEGEWWENPNGPIWLWWLIAILPLRTEIQMLMLSSKHLSKRMTAVLRTLDAMDYYSYIYKIM